MKQTWKRAGALLAALALSASITACGTAPAPAEEAPQTPEGADLVITNASVYTADAAGTTAQAVAVDDGIITYVGDVDGVQSYIGENTQVTDLAGGTLMPGVIDAHMHPAYNAVSFVYEIYLGFAESLEDYKTTIQEFVDEHPDATFYAGTGYSAAMFDEAGPRKEFLDELCPDKPMIIRCYDGHSYWVNSKSLELAGITNDTPDPEGGIIVRDPATGEATGVLQEEAAMALVADQKHAYTTEEYKEAILWVQDWFNAMGITTVFDAMIPLDNPNYYMAYQELAEEGKLTVRIRGAWHLYPEMADSLEELEAIVDKGIELSKGFTTDYFQVGAFKFFSDQVIEAGTGYLLESYTDRDDGWRGLKVWDDDVMAALFTKIDAAGFQIHVHQIGDAAANYTLDAIEKAVAANGERDSRHTFAHLQLITEEDQQRMADLNMCAIVAPYWMVDCGDVDGYYTYILGEERAHNMYPAESLIEKGIHVSTHSDFAVSIPNVTELFYNAMYRNIPEKDFQEWGFADAGFTYTNDPNATNEDGTTICPLTQGKERMTLDQIARAATIEGAYAHFLETETGSIEVGKKADLLAFEKDIFSMDHEEMVYQEPLYTYFEGNLVYDANQK